MPEIEQFLPGTKVSEWAATAIAVNPGFIATTAAYWAGGGGPEVTTVDKLAFVDDSLTTLSTGLSTARGYLAGMAKSGVAAYFGGGNTTTPAGEVDKFAFSNDSRTTLGTGLSSTRYLLGGAANSWTL